jgi:hypothetical protein
MDLGEQIEKRLCGGVQIPARGADYLEASPDDISLLGRDY